MGNNNSGPDETDQRRSMDAYREMEYKLSSLRSLVCDLLKTNQELRNALAEDGKIDDDTAGGTTITRV